jgi:hypothetical protein
MVFLAAQRKEISGGVCGDEATDFKALGKRVAGPTYEQKQE